MKYTIGHGLFVFRQLLYVTENVRMDKRNSKEIDIFKNGYLKDKYR